MPPRRPRALSPLVDRWAVLLVAATLALSGCGAAGDPPTVSPGGVDGLEVPTPTPDPDDFVARVDNPWLPLLPGAEWTYESLAGRTTTVTVEGTREVDGVAATVVREVERDEDGRVVAEGEDWYAQDRAGNVWWFGAEQDGPGSWEAGVDGAEAGLVMAARPRRGDGYRQALAPGVVEDRATVEELDGTRTVDGETLTDLVVVEERTPLDPGLVEQAFYARGTGLVARETVSGGTGADGGQTELVGFTPGEAAR